MMFDIVLCFQTLSFCVNLRCVGDLLPETDRARLFIIFYGILGTGMTANALTIFSEGV
jgi:hypothetical protein